MPFFHQWKKQEEKNINKWINEQPCEQHEFPFFGLGISHRQIYHFIKLKSHNAFTIKSNLCYRLIQSKYSTLVAYNYLIIKYL